MNLVYRTLFQNIEHANIVLDLINLTLVTVCHHGDTRLAVNLQSGRASDVRLPITFGKWKILAFRSIAGRRSFRFIAEVSKGVSLGLKVHKEYKGASDSKRYGLFEVDEDSFLAPHSPEHRIHLSALPSVFREFENWRASPVKLHNLEVLELLRGNSLTRAELLGCSSDLLR